jgi:hypothetical protein
LENWKKCLKLTVNFNVKHPGSTPGTKHGTWVIIKPHGRNYTGSHYFIFFWLGTGIKCVGMGKGLSLWIWLLQMTETIDSNNPIIPIMHNHIFVVCHQTLSHHFTLSKPHHITSLSQTDKSRICHPEVVLTSLRSLRTRDIFDPLILSIKDGASWWG